MLIFVCILLTGTLCRTAVVQPSTFGPDDRFMCHCAGDLSCDTNTGRCSEGCAGGWMGPGCQYRAIDGEQFLQLDLFDDASKARNAMDGSDNTCSRTRSGGHSSDPRWWRVSFKGRELVSGLEILTMEQHLSSFRGFKVYVEDSSDITTLPSKETLCYEDPGDSVNHVMIKATCREPVQGNQLRIQLKHTSDQLVLCEVKIPGGRNVAFKAATESSKHDPKTSPSLGVDGIISQSWSDCVYLVSSNDVWFKVDLGQPFSVSLMTVHFYIFEVEHQWSYSVKSSLNNNWTILTGEQTYFKWFSKHKYMEYRTLFEAREIRMKIQQGHKRVGICEFQVFGDCPDNKCGLDCKETCYCKRHSIYSKHSGICDSGCKDGWRGSVNGKCDTETRPMTSPTSVICSEHCKKGATCNADGSCPEGCESGWTGNSCSEATSPTTTPRPVTCPVHCKNGTTCEADGKCPAGCEPGWMGNNCSEECTDGTYGNDCKITCSINCKDSCDMVGGHCKNGCNPGWRGNFCNETTSPTTTPRPVTCPVHCKVGNTCDTDGSCSDGCEPGWTGNTCSQECSKGAWGEDCKQTCGNCLYTSGYTTCDHVTGRCQNRCTSVFKPPHCKECDDGRYGERCTQNCSGHCKYGSDCRKTDGHCPEGCSPGWQGQKCDHECKDGSYGNNCEEKCNANCKGSCGKVNGQCIQGCTAGWQGLKCDIDCNEGTWGDDCKQICGKCHNNECHHVTGHCSSCKIGFVLPFCKECIDGRYGESCNQICSGHCKDASYCDKTDGHCPEGCNPGWQGLKCDQDCPDGKYGDKCSQNCSGHCRGGDHCRKTDGRCLKGCSPGWNGARCNEECRAGQYGVGCRKYCSVHCKGGSSCNKIDGHCPGGCEPGWEGRRCHEKCAKKTWGEYCKRKCGNCWYTSTSCDHLTGYCYLDLCEFGFKPSLCKECLDGRHGERCNHQCSGHCKDNSDCRKTDGHCPKGCSPGWQGPKCDQGCQNKTYGNNCESTCSINCKGRCDKVNGKCTYGCNLGWQGDHCQNECGDRRYGERCMQHCSGHCKDGSDCRKTDGHCPKGCSPGWQGPKCDKACVAGTWGVDCKRSCGQCLLDMCDQKNGACPTGCQPGVKVTSLCDQECEVGTCGYNCSETCEGCLDGACDTTNGSCKNGCNPAYRPVAISNETKEILGALLPQSKNETDSCNMGLVIAVVALAVTCIALTLGITVLWVNLRKTRKNTTNERIEHSPVPDRPNITENVEMTAINPELSGAPENNCQPVMNVDSVAVDVHPEYQELGFRDNTEGAYSLLNTDKRPACKSTSGSVDEHEYTNVAN